MVRTAVVICVGLFLCRCASDSGVGAGGCALGVSQPAPASEASLNCLRFYDDFAGGTNTIDTNATGRPGFNWYPQNFFRVPATPSSDYDVSDSVLNVNEQPVPGGVGLQSVGPISFMQNESVGYEVKAPFYIEFKIAVNKSLAPGATGTGGCGVGQKAAVTRYSWPTIWLEDASLLFDQTNQTTTGGNRAEIDVLEFYVGCGGMAPGTWDQQANIHDWSAWNAIGNDSPHHVNWGSTWDDTTYHTVGVLVKTAVIGGGTGSATWYFDGSQMQQITWLEGGALSSTETSSYDIIMNPGYGTWPIHVSYVQVWQ